MAERHGTEFRRSAQLRAHGIAWLQSHRYARGDRVYRRLPLPWVTVVVSLGAPGRWESATGAWRVFPRVALRGHTDRWSIGEDEDGPVDYMAALLEPWAAPKILGLPLSTVKREVIDLSDVIGDDAQALLERLSAAQTAHQRLDLFESFLLAGTSDLEVDAQVKAFMRLCRARAGSVRLSDHIELHGLSDRGFRAAFTECVGCSPKAWARLERFAATVRHLHPNSWGADEGSRPEHYDQSHQIGEFRHFAGLTPGEYRRRKADGDARVFMIGEK